MTYPLRALPPLTPAQYREVRTSAIFDHLKWDPQIGDVAILADFPLLLDRMAWDTLVTLAEALAAETLAAERELRARPDLIPRLGLPAFIERFWTGKISLFGKLVGFAPLTDPLFNERDVRLMRFDFHYTSEGWKISEVNSDVPGGLNEATGYTQLMAARYDGCAPTGDPTLMLAKAIRAAADQPDALIGFVHATAYTDDRQVMQYLARHVEAEGLRTALISPTHVSWREGQALLNGETLDLLVRFFPGEWLPNLRDGWQPFFAYSPTPMCNPGTALLTQSKRFPLVWDALKTPLPTWRSTLPETRDMRDVATLSDEWVLKPAFGRVGESIHIAGVTPAKARDQAWREAKRRPDDWIVQRRFIVMPVDAESHVSEFKRWYPSIGVYTVNGRAAGIYARMGASPIIHATAPDVAVVIRR